MNSRREEKGVRAFAGCTLRYGVQRVISITHSVFSTALRLIELSKVDEERGYTKKAEDIIGVGSAHVFLSCEQREKQLIYWPCWLLCMDEHRTRLCRAATSYERKHGKHVTPPPPQSEPNNLTAMSVNHISPPILHTRKEKNTVAHFISLFILKFHPEQTGQNARLTDFKHYI